MDTWGEAITGGYVIFDVMSKLEPDFAVFAGDIIYADNPIAPTKEIPPEVPEVRSTKWGAGLASPYLHLG